MENLPPYGMELVTLAGLVVLALMVGYASLLLWRSRPSPQAVPPMVQDTPRACAGCEAVAQGLGHLKAEMQDLKLAVADGIEHVDRVENRIRGAVKRARKELQERGLSAPGLEAEAAGLSLVDDDRGTGAPVPVMPPRVAEDQSSVPGVTPEQLRRVRGI